MKDGMFGMFPSKNSNTSHVYFVEGGWALSRGEHRDEMASGHFNPDHGFLRHLSFEVIFEARNITRHAGYMMFAGFGELGGGFE